VRWLGYCECLQVFTEACLKVRGHERVVDDEDDAGVLVDDLGERLDVDEAEGGVGGRLDPDELCVWLDDGLDIADVAHVDKRRLEAVGRGHLGEVAVGAAVDVVDRDNVVARLEQADDGGRGRGARRERERVLAALQRSNRLLKGIARRVARARVLVLGLSGRLLLERGRERDGRDDCSGDGVGVLPPLRVC